MAVEQSQEAKGALVKLQELEAGARAYQDLYATDVTRYNSSLQQAASPIAEATIITPATPLIQRDVKKSIQLAALFPLAGLMLGLAIAFAREMLADRVLLTSKNVQSRLRIACLGVLPKVRAPRRPRWRWGKRARKGSDPRNIEQADLGISRDVVEHPFSHFAEGVRSIKFAIELESRSRASGAVVGITSSLANEGKSTVASAVAQMIASNGSSVILVDCDLRNPSLTRAISPTATAGIAELAYGKATLSKWCGRIRPLKWRSFRQFQALCPRTRFPGYRAPRPGELSRLFGSNISLLLSISRRWSQSLMFARQLILSTHMSS